MKKCTVVEFNFSQGYCETSQTSFCVSATIEKKAYCH